MRVNAFIHSQDNSPPRNLCGVLVHAHPGNENAVAENLRRLPGVEVHLAESGKLVVTVEDAEGQWADQTMASFNSVPGVLSVALVYHHFDSDSQGEVVP